MAVSSRRGSQRAAKLEVSTAGTGLDESRARDLVFTGIMTDLIPSVKLGIYENLIQHANRNDYEFCGASGEQVSVTGYRVQPPHP
jgi:hypothetical protein